MDCHVSILRCQGVCVLFDAPLISQEVAIVGDLFHLGLYLKNNVRTYRHCEFNTTHRLWGL
jgi:hypothetical protein